MPLAFKFGYNGRNYDGYAFQNIDDPPTTVEMSILKALRKIMNKVDCDLGKFHREISFRSASRTDKGVSALGNVVSFETEKDPKELARSLNSLVKDCFFWGFARAGKDFKPRRASSRWYRYHLGGNFQDYELRRMVNTANLFYGEHDFKNFCKKDQSGKDKSSIREIFDIDIEHEGESVIVDIKADGFCWHMMRKIVWTLQKSAREDISIAEVYNHLDEGADEMDIGLAPAEPLVLMDVGYKGMEFTKLPDVKKDEIVKRMMTLKDELRFLDLTIDKILD
jgi:tRNA pseudouridine38-40 synthase